MTRFTLSIVLGLFLHSAGCARLRYERMQETAELKEMVSSDDAPISGGDPSFEIDSAYITLLREYIEECKNHNEYTSICIERKWLLQSMKPGGVLAGNISLSPVQVRVSNRTQCVLIVESALRNLSIQRKLKRPYVNFKNDILMFVLFLDKSFIQVDLRLDAEVYLSVELWVDEHEPTTPELEPSEIFRSVRADVKSCDWQMQSGDR